MIQKIKGQSIIEYSLLAMIAIVGTLVMGPYLIRAVNAHFKLWQEPIEDSLHDPMTMKPTSSTPLLGGCQCSDFQPGECGAQFQRSNQRCASSQRYWYKSCNPPDCIFSSGFQEECRNDTETCCTKYKFCSTLPGGSLSGCCGNVPGTAREVTYALNGYPAAQIPSDPLNLPGYCYFGEEAIINDCFDPNNPKPDDIRCMPVPAGSPYPDAGQCVSADCIDLPTNSNLCAGSDLNLTANLPVTAIDCPSMRLDAKQSSASSAGGHMQYTSEILSAPANISVKVYTEDLIFHIQFFDESNHLIHEEYCLPGAGASPNPLPGQLINSCGGVDYEDPRLIDSYQTTYLASKVSVYVEEGGEDGSDLMGYEVTASSAQNCCPDYTANPDAPKCIAVCNANHYAQSPTYCASCPSTPLEDIALIDPSIWDTPPDIFWPENHNWQYVENGNGNVNDPDHICQAFGYPSGYWTSGPNPSNNGFVFIEATNPGRSQFSWDVNVNGRIVRLGMCTNCGNGSGQINCVRQPLACDS